MFFDESERIVFSSSSEGDRVCTEQKSLIHPWLPLTRKKGRKEEIFGVIQTAPFGFFIFSEKKKAAICRLLHYDPT